MMKKIITLTLALALSACGWTPLYAPNGDDFAAPDIFVGPISGTNGVDLRNILRTNFGADSGEKSAKYTLSVNLSDPQTIYKALQKTGDATWDEVRITASYKLTETATGRAVLSATDTASNSYTFVRDLVAANASHDSATESATNLLAGEITTRVMSKIMENNDAK